MDPVQALCVAGYIDLACALSEIIVGKADVALKSLEDMLNQQGDKVGSVARVPISPRGQAYVESPDGKTFRLIAEGLKHDQAYKLAKAARKLNL